ncbi:hypothetical protein NOV72_06036 [Caballeronia novacaledonica]|uniref:Uncharacterized protein n=1 Tax=Caballeronia novacaledonica TaxID=1544861 RepID=A0A2U3IF15_9BURK|nr:hypothetical protein [Caballeronia novacaledonica]SPB18830.1 hypothetical protein NOV72_06036 [Caballeronia novacaledonica]
MTSKTIGGLARDAIPPRVKIPPRSTRTVDMSTPEARQRVTDAISRVISAHNVAIKELAKR